MPIAVILDWYGPYKDLKKLTKVARAWGRDKTVYLATEMGDLSDPNLKINYIGLSIDPESRFRRHPALENDGNGHFYIAEITTSGIPGRRSRKTPPDLHAAEGALISALQPALNKRRKGTPSDCVVVYSRFFGKKNEYKAKPTPKWFPAVVAYNSLSNEWHT
ncbi:hypothetical protein KUV47_21025 [Vannielia litorea]|uniref:hypothetical protein n=1 Tax=Vannielia litorea TaxID=1217970 RepID=UPI001C9877DB|nr:hypothetical protein [Vannielia litorea]MBY6155713.1 hypothetical protein [Vannielia litorea]